MPLTVLQIIPNLDAGGGEQACVDMVAGLKARGDRAIVVSGGGRRVSELARNGGEHVLRSAHSKNPFVILANAFWLARFIRMQKVDIVHARSRAPAWSAWIASRMTSRPFVTTFNAVYKISNPLKKFYNRVMTRGDKVIVISKFVADHVREIYGISDERLRVLYRGIHLENFAPDQVTEARRAVLRKAWQVEEGARIILLPARLSPIKGHILFIKAMALLPKELSSVVGVMIGDDQGREDYRRELEELIRDKNLKDRVRLVDHCSDMPAAYSLADLVAMPSLVPEGFGRVPVEAMAMGVPVVASALGATVETVLEGETGWLLPPEDPKAWAETIARGLSLSKDQRTRMAAVARARALSLFDVSRMIKETLALYDEMVGKK
ncbi:MAG: glycosyltransferase family 4 protein [Alphaproteobacteria bacterium]|nr:glycosyltransferase family 4 protein [Alphaproteobacteria bacterium]